MAAGSGRAAILRHRHNGDRKKYPILLSTELHVAIRRDWGSRSYIDVESWQLGNALLTGENHPAS